MIIEETGVRRLVSGVLVAALLLCVFVGCGKKDAVESDDIELSETVDIFSSAESGASGYLSPTTVVARVNDHEILFSELQGQMEQLIMSMPQAPPAEVLQGQIPALLKRVLDNLLTVELLEKAIGEENIAVPESDVVKRLRQIAAELPEGVRLSEILEERGSSLEEFQDSLRRDMAIRKLLDLQTADIPEITDADIADFHAENPEQFKVPELASAHHILIGFRAEDSEEVKQSKLDQINAIRQEILAGADFEEMAREHSTGPSAQDGGNLGRFPRGQMLPVFDEAVFSQPLGELGEPVETRFGYHIIRVDDREPAGSVDLAEASEDIKAHLQSRRKQAALAEYLQQLRDQSDIQIFTDLSKINVTFDPDVSP